MFIGKESCAYGTTIVVTDANAFVGIHSIDIILPHASQGSV